MAAHPGVPDDAGLHVVAGARYPAARMSPPTGSWGPAADGPLVIGHRGASAHALENTLAAFRRARADGADGVELDVLACLTGEIVVFHDETLARLAGRPEAIGHLSLGALREVRLTGGEPISTLDEVLEELGPLLINVELKVGTTQLGLRLADAVAKTLRRHGTGTRVLVSSFHPVALGIFRARAPSVPTGLLFAADQSRPLREAWARHGLRPLALHPGRQLASERSVGAWRREGYAINVWTVDGAEEVSRVAALGVDGIITNDPAATRAILDGKR